MTVSWVCAWRCSQSNSRISDYSEQHDFGIGSKRIGWRKIVKMTQKYPYIHVCSHQKDNIKCSYIFAGVVTFTLWAEIPLFSSRGIEWPKSNPQPGLLVQSQFYHSTAMEFILTHPNPIVENLLKPPTPTGKPNPPTPTPTPTGTGTGCTTVCTTGCSTTVGRWKIKREMVYPLSENLKTMIMEIIHSSCMLGKLQT